MLPAAIPLLQYGVSAIFLAITTYYVNNNYLNYNGVLNNTWLLHKDLDNHLYGQKVAAYQLVDFLGSEKSNSGAYILLLIGGPGVGKTYATSIATKYYNPEKFYVHIIPSLQPLDDNAFDIAKSYIKWVTTGFSLVIIDYVNLIDNNLIIFLNKINTYCKQNNLVSKILVLGDIIKVHSKYANGISAENMKSYEQYVDYILNYGSKAETKFYNNGLNTTKLAMFMPLDPSHVKKCIYASLASVPANKYPSENIINDIVKDVCNNRKDFSPSGCKDVHAYTIPFNN